MRRAGILGMLALAVLWAPAGARAANGPFNGKIAFVTDRDGNEEIYTMNSNGTQPTRLTNDPAVDTHPSWSPDGTKIAFTSARDGNNEIYVMSATGANPTRITINPASDSQPTWSPDGNKIVFQSTRGGGFDIFSMNADGTGVVQLTNDPGFDTDPAFSPTGSKIVFSSSRDGNFEIYSMNPNGSAQTRLTNNTTFESRPDFSPNGAKITFASNVPDGGGFSQQVLIMNANGTGITQLTTDGGGNPAFSADGKQILFTSSRDLNMEVYSMNVDGSSETRITDNLFMDAAAVSQRQIAAETIGVYRPTTGQWLLRTSNTPGPTNITINFGGQPGDIPVPGNWNGDNRMDVGVFRDGVFHLGIVRKAFGVTIVEPLPDFAFGQAGDLPVSGDWNGDGIDDVGVFRPTAPTKFLLRQPVTVSSPFNFTIITTISFDFGAPGDLPVAGDWDGDGDDTAGVFRTGEFASFLLANENNSTVNITFDTGTTGDQPIAGDWLATGQDRVGLFRESVPIFFLHNEFASKVNTIVTFGQPGDIPVAGDWAP